MGRQSGSRGARKRPPAGDVSGKSPRADEQDPSLIERGNNPWVRNIPPHPPRRDSREYRRARKLTTQKAASVADFFYGAPPYEDHHGGGLWLKDDQGWFMVRNLVGMEWSAQFCADPAKVDRLRQNARRLYAAFPGVAEELGIRELLDTPITDARGVARWTDSICNASVALPKPLHTGVLPRAGGLHHYPAPVAEIALFKYDDFELWVRDEEGQPTAVAPVGPRGSGDGRVRVLFATPGTRLEARLAAATPPPDDRRGLLAPSRDDESEGLILPADDPLARQAFRKQTQQEEDGR